MKYLAPLMLFILMSSPAWSATPDQELIELGKRVEKRISKLRGLASKKPIRWEMTTKEKVRQYLLIMLHLDQDSIIIYLPSINQLLLFQSLI